MGSTTTTWGKDLVGFGHSTMLWAFEFEIGHFAFDDTQVGRVTARGKRLAWDGAQAHRLRLICVLSLKCFVRAQGTARALASDYLIQHHGEHNHSSSHKRTPRGINAKENDAATDNGND